MQPVAGPEAHHSMLVFGSLLRGWSMLQCRNEIYAGHTNIDIVPCERRNKLVAPIGFDGPLPHKGWIVYGELRLRGRKTNTGIVGLSFQ